MKPETVNLRTDRDPERIAKLESMTNVVAQVALQALHNADASENGSTSLSTCIVAMTANLANCMANLDRAAAAEILDLMAGSIRSGQAPGCGRTPAHVQGARTSGPRRNLAQGQNVGPGHGMTRAAPTFIATPDVAQLLGVSDGLFLRRRGQLEEYAGFPEPMPHCRRPLRWRRDQVLAWIEGQGRPRDAESSVDPALVASGQVILLAEARRP